MYFFNFCHTRVKKLNFVLHSAKIDIGEIGKAATNDTINTRSDVDGTSIAVTPIY